MQAVTSDWMQYSDAGAGLSRSGLGTWLHWFLYTGVEPFSPQTAMTCCANPILPPPPLRTAILDTRPYQQRL